MIIIIIIQAFVRRTFIGVGFRLKVGINIEKSEGVGLGRGCALPSWGSGGLPQKKNQFCAKKLCNSEQVLVFLSIYYSTKWGIIPQS